MVDNEIEQDEWIEDNRGVENYEWLGVVFSQDLKPKSALVTPLYYWDAGWYSVTEQECREFFLTMVRLFISTMVLSH